MLAGCYEMSRYILKVGFVLLLVFVFASSGWSQSKNSPSRKTESSQLAPAARKPTIKQLALVESTCSKGVLNQVALHMGIAAYPPQARQKHIGGKVTIKVYVNEGGDVYHAIPIDGPKLLRASAASAASWSRFVPFEMNNTPVKCAGLLVYNFVAQELR